MKLATAGCRAGRRSIHLVAMLMVVALAGRGLPATAQTPGGNLIVIQVCQAAIAEEAAPGKSSPAPKPAATRTEPLPEPLQAQCGMPVAGVNVQLNNARGTAVKKGKAPTNHRGEASLEHVPDGQFLLVIEGQGWQTQTRPLLLAGGGTTSLVIALEH